MNPEPFRIEPTFSPRIWGSRSLAPIYPDKTNLPEPIGEAWLTDVNCRVATGPFAGKTLGESWRAMPAEWRGKDLARVNDFPILAKFLFPTDNLSIQVHPDDAYASVHEKAAGGRGKTEMWHILSAEPGAHVLLGLKPGATKEKFLAALASGTVENLFNTVPVSAGDTIFVPARTGHAIGPGIILCEVQEYSDLTYRVYDYNRLDAHGHPRELHTAKALQVMNFSSSVPGKVPPLPLVADRNQENLLAACRYFATERWDLLASAPSKSSGNHFELLIVLAGSGCFHWKGEPLRYRLGECWFLPASLENYIVQPEQKTSLLRAFVPDLADLREQLRARGFSEAQWSQAVFD